MGDPLIVCFLVTIPSLKISTVCHRSRDTVYRRQHKRSARIESSFSLRFGYEKDRTDPQHVGVRFSRVGRPSPAFNSQCSWQLSVCCALLSLLKNPLKQVLLEKDFCLVYILLSWQSDLILRILVATYLLTGRYVRMQNVGKKHFYRYTSRQQWVVVFTLHSVPIN